MRYIHKQWYSEKLALTVTLSGPAHTNPSGPCELHVETIDGERRWPITPEELERIAAEMRDPQYLYKPKTSKRGTE